MKKIIPTIIIGLSITTTTVFAEETTMAVPTLYAMPVSVMTSQKEEVVNMPTLTIPSSISPVTEKGEVINIKTLPRIKARGAQLIKERVNSLNQNNSAVQKSKDLTTEQKMAFSMFFEGKISELNTLNTKIQEQTEASTTKILVESIFSDFRIYGITIPQIRLQKRIYEVQNHATKVSENLNKIQNNIDLEKSKGKDVTVWQKNLDDSKLIIATNTSKLSNLLTLSSSLKPSDYGTTSKKVIMDINNSIKEISKEINTINKKIRKPTYMKTIRATTTPTTTTNQATTTN